MKVSIIQSNYIPWRGYFDLIKQTDTFVIYDDVQFTKNDWRNRNKIKIKDKSKPIWLSVPVFYNFPQLILETKIDYSKNWQKKHLTTFKQSYSKALYFKESYDLYKDVINQDVQYISELNIRLIKVIMEYLEIETKLISSSELNVSGQKTERLVSILKKLGATTYVSGPTAKNYLDEQLFIDVGIGLEYKTYDYSPYPQLWGEFNGYVSILDLIANTGKEAKNYIKSQTPNEIIISS